jgi:hypothetical protein
MTGMKKLAWELFEQTGEIGYYNLFKALADEEGISEI